MTQHRACRLCGCERMVSKAGYCRPHFISEFMGWSLGPEDLKQVPLQRLSTLELRALRRATFGEYKLWRILKAIREIAPVGPPQAVPPMPFLEAAE